MQDIIMYRIIITTFPNHLLLKENYNVSVLGKNDVDSVSLVQKTALKGALRGSGY
jgi:hypothetical protein